MRTTANKMSEVMSVRFPPDERARVETAAARAGFNAPSTFVRDAAVQAAAAVLSPAAAERAKATMRASGDRAEGILWSFADDEGARMRANAVRAIGTNVNQIARAMNLVQSMADAEPSEVGEAMRLALMSLPDADALAALGVKLNEAARVESEFAKLLRTRRSASAPGGASR